MPKELRDSLGRLRVTPETDAWLEAKHRNSGASKHDIARDALHHIALRELSYGKLLTALAPREGSSGKAGEGGDSKP